MRLRTHIAVAAGAALLAATGIAAPTFASDSGRAANGTAAFRAEAVRDGLSAQQISGLQQKVDAFIAESGGKQIAANKVAVEGGSVTFTVPGEKYARALNSGLNGNSPATAAASCPYYYFCGYKGSNFTGEQWNRSSCVLHEIPDGWNSGGSWINNQSGDTRARMYNKSKSLIYTTPPAYSSDADGDWGPVWYVRPC
ncbi:peptidase inhibitor family I36 protein [Streptomyces lavendofoliae]|uniref:Secreted protein n=1 Tax=Streptomyces lavendofoliae TaxID=67314 RepID=A0A918M4D4_9ACTN|nr:peptidase inhibitor family I36 protein [Streptomyces lavendofoliae]GGU37809.1 hypothetical protein GCM10010274_26350 [Streptomyces lavendofoliae]